MWSSSLPLGFLIILLTALPSLSSPPAFPSPPSDLAFPLSLWGRFQLNSPHLSIMHSLTHHRIQFTGRSNSGWNSSILFAQEALKLTLQKQNSKLLVLANNSYLAISAIQIGQNIKISKDLVDKQGWQLVFMLQNKQITVDLTNINSNLVEVIATFDVIVFRSKGSTFGSDLQDQQQRIAGESKSILNSFMKTHSIGQKHQAMTEHMLSLTLSQLCLQQLEFQSFIGLCFSPHQGKKHSRHSIRYEIDIRYSLLIIDKLLEGYSKTALFLFQQMVGLLQQKLFYSHSRFVPIPEHISILTNYIALSSQSSSSSQASPSSFQERKKIKKFNGRVKALLNGLMNQMLLAQVNNLEEQINYRQQNKLHPTLLKMLKLKWQSSSLKNAISSIYEESFTPDYFYHTANQKLDTCSSKKAWLTKTAIQYIHFLKKTGLPDDLSAIEQPNSLTRILQRWGSTDPHEKEGRYFSIGVSEGVRVYLNSIGYESLLPYTYNLTNNFPLEHFQNLTTPYGLASLNRNSPQWSAHFEFRGNIHLYFNYKILDVGVKRVEKGKQGRLQIEGMRGKVGKFIEEAWRRGQSGTMWSSQGQILQNRRHLSLLNALFMGE